MGQTATLTQRISFSRIGLIAASVWATISLSSLGFTLIDGYELRNAPESQTIEGYKYSKNWDYDINTRKWLPRGISLPQKEDGPEPDTQALLNHLKNENPTEADYFSQWPTADLKEKARVHEDLQRKKAQYEKEEAHQARIRANTRKIVRDSIHSVMALMLCALFFFCVRRQGQDAIPGNPFMTNGAQP